MYELLDYEDKYEKSLIQLWIDVCVDEFGFAEWKNDISNVEKDLYEKIIIAIHDDVVIGSIAYKNSGSDVAELKRVYVHPNFRGSGIAQHLLDLIIEEVKLNGYKKLELETRDRFDRAIGFYSKNGFSLCGREGDCVKYERLV